MSIINQEWDARQYAETARWVSDLGMPVVDLLAPQPGERILDLGCGDGVLTRRFADLGCEVLGIDAGPDMVRAASERGVDARVVDARALPFDNEFDAVFSNAALHWMGSPEPVLTGVWKALKPGGRFVGECGGAGNVTIVRAALEAALTARGIDPHRVNPWYYASDVEYREIFDRLGFTVSSLALFPRPTPLTGTLIHWLKMFGQSFIAAVPEADRDDFLEDVSARCEPSLRASDGSWVADYVRLRFAAVKPR